MKKVLFYGLLLLGIFLVGVCIPDSYIEVDFQKKNQPPSMEHLFGTDWYGRDLFARSLKGLSTSLFLGATASLASGVIALFVGILSGLSPKWVDQTIGFVIDLMMSMPHLVLQLLISYSLGGGVKGVLWSLILTHWTSLARLLRGEVLRLKEEQWVKVAKKSGKSPIYISIHHLLPNLFPHCMVGVVLSFPHAILHESSLTFLGFGLSPEQSAIGVMMAESVGYLSAGYWWMLSSGICLSLTVCFFAKLGEGLQEALF